MPRPQRLISLRIGQTTTLDALPGGVVQYVSSAEIQLIGIAAGHEC